MSDYVPDFGDIIWLNFTPQSGHEQAGQRPALVLSPLIYNKASGLCLCVPITSKIKGYPFEVPIALQKPSVILSDQLKSVDFRARQVKFLQKADETALKEVQNNLAELLNLAKFSTL